MSPPSEASYTPHQLRSRDLQVLSLGLPRTGTASMALALTQLGYGHCAHGMDMLTDFAIAARWESAADAKFSGRGKPFGRADFDELLGHCGAVTDMPHAVFWRELWEAYPGAKVVLVRREEERWFRSFSEGVVEPLFSASGRFNRRLVEPLLGSRIGAMSVKVLEGFFGASGAEGIRGRAREVYRRHYEDVKKVIPEERLLEYELGSGWEPLCRFLGKDVPDAEFPWVNEADALKEKIEDVKKKMAQEVQVMFIYRVLPILGLALAVLVAWRSNVASR